MMKSEPIKKIRKKFHNEWLLIAVDKTDPATSTSVSGRLLAHSHSRDAIYKKLLRIKSKSPVLVDYSEDDLPHGMVAIF